MTNCPAGKSVPNAVADILECMPGPEDAFCPVEKLCKGCHENSPACKRCVAAVVSTIQAIFGAVRVQQIEGSLASKAASEPAWYFLRSLAKYLRKNRTVLSDWGREGAADSAGIDRVPIKGAQFVRMMEEHRVKHERNPDAIREETVAVVVIKARLRDQDEPAYLLRYDGDARQYQLVGAKKCSDDADPLQIMQRVMAHELSLQPDQYELDERISLLPLKCVSRTYGAYTRYYVTVYFAMLGPIELQLEPSDRWATLDELLAGSAGDGKVISEFAPRINESLPGGFERLPFGTDTVQNPPPP